MNNEFFFNKGKALILAYDHGFEHGLKDFNNFSQDPLNIFLLAKKGGFTGLVLHKGLAEIYKKRPFFWRVPLIIKLNGKTPFSKEDIMPPLDCSVEYAYSLKAQGIGYTIYLGSKYESEMIREFREIQEEAKKKGLVVIGWFYPISEEILKLPNFTRDACRLALELGVDIVKIKYPGSIEELKKIQKFDKIKIVLAGGILKEEKEFLTLIKKIIKLNIIDGLLIGRNVFSNKNPYKIVEKIKAYLFKTI